MPLNIHHFWLSFLALCTRDNPFSVNMSVLPQDAVLPQGSTILVTGANGYIGSHVINQLLKYGYKARGTVRDGEKSAWLQEHFDKEYGTGNFELVEVKEITKLNLLGPLKG